MKRSKFIVLLLGIVCLPCLFSCSDSDDDEDVLFEKEQNEAESAKYVINSQESPFESMELLADGTYILGKRGYSSSAAAKRSITIDNTNKLSISLFKRNKITSRAASNTFYKFGNYTVSGDGVYVLEGYGKVTISAASGSNYSLIFEDNSTGISFTVTAAKESTVSSSNQTTNLCRSWDLVSEEYSSYYNKTLVEHYIYDGINKAYTEQYSNDGVDYFDSVEEMAKKVVFSKSGTYIVYYNSGDLEVSNWKWSNESKGILCYYWEADSNGDYEDDGGYVSVLFSKDSMTVTEEQSDEDSQFKCVTILKPSKN